MDRNKTVGIVVTVLGVIFLVLSIIVDWIGIGSPGFGYRQIAGMAVGALVAAGGLYIALWKPS
jgi:hypothetical protein